VGRARRQDDLLQPYLSLELQTGMSERSGGKPIETSLHEDALALLMGQHCLEHPPAKEWPAAVGDPPEPAGSETRRHCQCSVMSARNPAGGAVPKAVPASDVHGGQVQYIRKGDRMPQALLLPRQTFWQKVKRIQPSVESSRIQPPGHWSTSACAPHIDCGGVAPAVIRLCVGLGTSVGRKVPLGSYLRTG
jgi:hypothetical protein